MTPGSREVAYLVLADRAAPYLLARVRWPDVAQAITAGSPDWLDDPGLFDLPYEPSAVAVSFTQAASVAAGWGRQLHAEPAQGVPSFIRRMPANWSDLSPVERRAYGLESVGRRRVSARRLRRLRSSREKIGVRVPVANGHAGALAGDRNSAGVHRRAANGHSQVAGVTSAPGGATERRRQVRVSVDGRAHIRYGHATISAGLVDLSEGGVRCVLPEDPQLVAPGVKFGGPILLEAEMTTSRICLDVTGRISWRRSAGADTHFGVAFAELADGETDGLQRFLVAANGKGRR